MPSCCDEYGKCTEGQGCPVRSTQVHQPDSEESLPILKEMLTDGAYYLGLWLCVSGVFLVLASAYAAVYTGKPLWTLICEALG